MPLNLLLNTHELMLSHDFTKKISLRKLNGADTIGDTYVAHTDRSDCFE